MATDFFDSFGKTQDVVTKLPQFWQQTDWHHNGIFSIGRRDAVDGVSELLTDEHVSNRS